MTKQVKVVAAVITGSGASLYTTTGEVVTLSSAEHNAQEIVAQIVAKRPSIENPVLFDIETNTVFSDIEKKSGGLLRFFTVPISNLGKILGNRFGRGKVDEGGMVQSAPQAKAKQPGTEPVTPQIVEQLQAAHDLQEATAATTDTTVVAVVGNTPIVGAEALRGHGKAALATNNTEGFNRFMERLATVAASRKHTAQELMKFMEKNDLPIANDGPILGFKSLRRTDDPEVFADDYTQKIKQRVGTLVRMDVELVDDNRRVLCSNGLHIARKAYITLHSSYAASRNAIFLVKIAPEDVISVPMGEQNKMRVASYHIIAKLSEEECKRLASGLSITKGNDFASNLLAKAVRGEHPGVTNISHQKADGTIDQMVPVAQDGHIIPSAAEIAHEVVLPTDTLEMEPVREELLVGLEDEEDEAGELEALVAEAPVVPVPEEPTIPDQVQTVDEYQEGTAPEQKIDVRAINEQLAAEKKAKTRTKEVKSSDSTATPKKAKKVSLVDTSRIEGKTNVTVPDARPVPVEMTPAAKRQEAVKAFKAGETKASIGKRLGVAESTLRGWLKNV